MRIGKEQIPNSAICTANRDTIVVRGRDLCEDLIGKISFSQYFWYLSTGDMPNDSQVGVLDACLVAAAEHGLVPSVIATRMTLAAAPEAMQGAVAAGILGAGSVVLGSAESAGRFLAEVLEGHSASDDDLEAAALATVKRYREQGRSIPGYGHPLHTNGDPRARRLAAFAREQGISTRYLDAATVVEAVIPQVLKRSLPMNVSVVLPAVLLDAGFPLNGLKGIPLLARTAGLIGHVLEEMATPIGFALSYQAAKEAEYTGVVPPGFDPDLV